MLIYEPGLDPCNVITKPQNINMRKIEHNCSVLYLLAIRLFFSK